MLLTLEGQTSVQTAPSETAGQPYAARWQDSDLAYKCKGGGQTSVHTAPREVATAYSRVSCITYLRRTVCGQYMAYSVYGERCAASIWRMVCDQYMAV